MDLKHGEKYKSIGIKIAKYRKERHMTQEELANGVGVSYGYITQIEAPNYVKKMSRTYYKTRIEKTKNDKSLLFFPIF